MAKNAKDGKAAKDAQAAKDGQAAKDAKEGAKPESDVQRRMREALEAKQARNKTAHGEDHLSGRGVGYAANDVTKRQFRRKAGG